MNKVELLTMKSIRNLLLLSTMVLEYAFANNSCVPPDKFNHGFVPFLPLYTRIDSMIDNKNGEMTAIAYGTSGELKSATSRTYQCEYGAIDNGIYQCFNRKGYVSEIVYDNKNGEMDSIVYQDSLGKTLMVATFFKAPNFFVFKSTFASAGSPWIVDSINYENSRDIRRTFYRDANGTITSFSENCQSLLDTCQCRIYLGVYPSYYMGALYTNYLVWNEDRVIGKSTPGIFYATQSCSNGLSSSSNTTPVIDDGKARALVPKQKVHFYRVNGSSAERTMKLR